MDDGERFGKQAIRQLQYNHIDNSIKKFKSTGKACNGEGCQIDGADFGFDSGLNWRLFLFLAKKQP